MARLKAIEIQRQAMQAKRKAAKEAAMAGKINDPQLRQKMQIKARADAEEAKKKAGEARKMKLEAAKAR